MTGADVVVAATMLFAAFTQGVIGFGYGLLVMSVLPRLLPLPDAVGTVAVSGLFVCTYILWRYRTRVDWRAVGRLCAGGALGLPLGVLVLREVDPVPCIRLLGAVLAAYGAWGLRRSRRARRQAPPATAWAYPAGFLGGVLGGAFATGGPPVVVYATAQRWSAATFRGVLQGFFTAFTICHIVALAATGLLPADVARRGLLLMPLVPVGVWVGARCGDRMHPDRFRAVVLAALLLTGVSYLVMGR